MSAYGGLIVEADAGLRYVPADVAVRLFARPNVTPVPGLPAPALGVALAEERVALVLRVGPHDHAPAILCELGGESVALVGARVVAVAAASDGVVHHEGEAVPPLDLGAMFGAVEAALLGVAEGTSG